MDVGGKAKKKESASSSSSTQCGGCESIVRVHLVRVVQCICCLAKCNRGDSAASKSVSIGSRKF